MSIRFSCRSCGKAYKVKDEMVGKRVRCTGCQQELLVTKSSDAPKRSLDTPPAKPLAAAAGKSCPKCKASCAATAIICMHCGFNYKTGQATDVGYAVSTHQGIGIGSKIAAGVVILALLVGVVIGGKYGFDQLAASSAPKAAPVPAAAPMAHQAIMPTSVEVVPPSPTDAPAPTVVEAFVEPAELEGSYVVKIDVQWRDEHGAITSGAAASEGEVLTLARDGSFWMVTLRDARWSGPSLQGLRVLYPVVGLGESFANLPGGAALTNAMLAVTLRDGQLFGEFVTLGAPGTPAPGGAVPPGGDVPPHLAGLPAHELPPHELQGQVPPTGPIDPAMLPGMPMPPMPTAGFAGVTVEFIRAEASGKPPASSTDAPVAEPMQ